MHWAPRGLLILGGEAMGAGAGSDPAVDAWLWRGPILSDESTPCWVRMPPLDIAGASQERGVADAAAAPVDAHRLLVYFGGAGCASRGFAPVFYLLEHSPWRWARCRCVGAVPRGVRRGSQLARSAEDVLILSGGHNGTRENQFGDPESGFHARHETRLLRLLRRASLGEPPILRFGACTNGPAAFDELPPDSSWGRGGALEAELGLWRQRRSSRWNSRNNFEYGQEPAVLVHGLERRADLNGALGSLPSLTPCASAHYQVRQAEAKPSLPPTNRSNALVPC